MDHHRNAERHLRRRSNRHSGSLAAFILLGPLGVQLGLLDRPASATGLLARTVGDVAPA